MQIQVINQVIAYFWQYIYQVFATPGTVPLSSCKMEIL